MWVAAPEIVRTLLHGLPTQDGIRDVRILAPLVPLGALSACLTAGARGFGRMWPYLAIEGLGKPALRIALVVGALVAGASLSTAVVAWAIPVAAGLIAASMIFTSLLRHETPPRPGVRHKDQAAEYAPISSTEGTAVSAGATRAQASTGRHRGRLRIASTHNKKVAAEFWSFTGPRAFQGTFQIVILWLDILIVGAMTSSYDAGIYNAVSKLAIVGTFTLEGNRLAIAPQLSALLARNQNRRAAQLYQKSTQWLMLASWPFYLVLAVFPATVLGIFGHKYTAGAAALAVLSLAMLVNLGTGNVTVVLLMGGRSSWSAINAAAALAVNIGLNLVLIPRMGILGAAIAWAASIVVDNVTAMAEIRWVMGLDPFGPGYLLAAGTGLACFGCTGLATRLLLGQSLLALVVACAAGAAAFAVALYLGRARFQLASVMRVLRPARQIVT
jgi:O-antigen/teichoic acid export membrane protein